MADEYDIGEFRVLEQRYERRDYPHYGSDYCYVAPDENAAAAAFRDLMNRIYAEQAVDDDESDDEWLLDCFRNFVEREKHVVELYDHGDSRSELQFEFKGATHCAH